MASRAFLVVCGMALATTTAHAQGNAGAEQLFRDGRDALAAGKTAEACDLFQRSNVVEPRVGTLLNLGDCRERLGQTATAWAVFVEARTLAVRDNDPRGDEAGRRAAALEPRLAYLTINAPSIDGLVVTRAGAEVKPAEWGVALPVDPGVYVVEARADGRVPWSSRIEVVAASRIELAIPELVATPAVAHEPASPPPIETRTTASPASPEPSPKRFGAGLALAASSDAETFVGLRGFGELPIARQLGLRGTGQMLVTRYRTDAGWDRTAFSFSIGVDAVFHYKRLAFGAGLGGLLDVEHDVYTDATGSNSMNSTGKYFLARATPLIVRLGPVEAGLHGQFVFNDGLIAIGTLGVDYVAW